jgi:hypothetical protein
MTKFMAGLVANFEYDLRKIIALSTKGRVASLAFIQTASVCLFLFVKR